MPDWFRELAAGGGELSVQAIVSRMIVSVITGLVVGSIYHGSQRKPINESFSFFVTLVLLTMLVSVTTMVIGESVARAFSLVGALSIVRFRTVVDDTRDTAFVIFAVVSGMAVGAGTTMIYFVAVPLIGLTSLALSVVSRGFAVDMDRRLEIRVEGGIDTDALLAQVFQEQLVTRRLTSVATAKQGAALDLTYLVRLVHPDASLQFVKRLTQLDGVQSVELK